MTTKTKSSHKPGTHVEQIEIQTRDGVSWRRGENGTRTLRLRSVRADRHFVELSVEEIAHPEESGGRYISRQTFFLAEGQHAEAIVDAVAPGYANVLEALVAWQKFEDTKAGPEKLRAQREARRLMPAALAKAGVR